MRRRLLAAALVAALLVVSVTVPDSPYADNRHTERIPIGPDVPAEFTNETAREYIEEYEERVLTNGLLGSRGFTTDDGDRIETACESLTTNRTNGNAYLVRIQCRGRIVDVYRVVHPGPVSYTVTYRLTEDGPTELSIEGYPLDGRDELWVRPPG